MDDRPDAASEPVATLDHLTGGAEGIQSTLHGETLDVFLHANKRIHIAPARTGSEGGQEIARLHLAAGSYEIVARGIHPLWVN